MLSLHESHLQATDGTLCPMRSCAWPGSPILDAHVVQADYGHLLVLAADGTLHGIDLDAGTAKPLCTIALPDLSTSNDQSSFGIVRHRLHASMDGRHAAVVVDHGQHGVLVDVLSGAVTMHLHGGSSRENTVPFSACFLRFDGHNVLIHRTDWNRLDAADAATGKSLTDRHIPPREAGVEPEHHLDYFHGQVWPSPDGRLIVDDGWVWHPVAMPRVWSVVDWLGSNPWESDDGPSAMDMATRDDWTMPACWIDNQRFALWGLAEWDDEASEETRQGQGVRIFHLAAGQPPSNEKWPLDVEAQRIVDLLSDGTCLYVSADTGTTVWDVASRMPVAGLPGFTARLLDRARHALVSFGPDEIRVVSIPWTAAK